MMELNELLRLVTKFMSKVDRKIKVEIGDQAHDDMPTVIVTFASRREYLIGCDHDAKTMDRYVMKPKCFFACRGEVHHSNSYYEPDDFEWIDIAVNQDSLSAVCAKVALDDYKLKMSDFAESIDDIIQSMYEDGDF